MTEKKKVVIIGCGYAGATAAKSLDQHSKLLDLTVITKRENFFVNKFSALRAAVADGNWIKRTMIPLSSLVKNGKVVQANVTSVDYESKCVVLENGDKVPYDILCIASGTRNFSPAEPALNVFSKEDTEAHYKRMHEALSKTKNVVIVGSGPVAIELAGEIRTSGQKDAKITIVTRSEHVLQARTPITNGNKRSMEALLANEKIDIIYKDQVASIPFPEDLSNASPLVETPDGVALKSGKEIKCELLVYTVGSYPNTKYLPPAWIDQKTKEVIVDEKTLKVVGTENVFAVGDCAKINYTKLGYYAMEDGKIVAQNILLVARGKPATKSISRSSLLMVIPFGPSKGRLLMPWFSLGGWAASSIKGSNLFTSMMWGQVAPGQKLPPV